MRKKTFSFLFVLLLLSFQFLIFCTPVAAYYTNMSASVVIGQPDFTSKTALSANSNTLSLPGGILVTNSKLLIPDYSNNRILIYNQLPTINNLSADVVIGQSSFTNNSANQGLANPTAYTLNRPNDLATDGQKLFVIDSVNFRVLIFNSIPNSNNASADVVIGQSSMSTKTNGTTSTSFSTNLTGIAFDTTTGKLIVADAGNNRVLIYNQIPTSNGTAADVVIGQVDFTHGSANQGGTTQANTLSTAFTVTISNGKLFIDDYSNNRVLIFNSIPTTNNASADVVIGQPDFTSNSTNQGLSTAASNTLLHPRRVASDGKRLFISDEGNNRLLIYNSIPTTNNASADLVLGQPDFLSKTSNQGGSLPSDHTLNGPFGVTIFNSKLIVSDQSNNRILVFNNVIATPEISFGGVEKLSGGKVRIKGTVKMGEAGHYDLGAGGGVSFSVNGVDGAGINTIGNQMSDGAGSLLYDFSNDFEPWTGGNGNKDDWVSSFDTLRSSRGFTVKVTSRNSNTDSSRIFYFEPFKITSFSPSVTKFSVNKYQVQTIKDNVDHFEIWVKNTASTTSTSLVSTISSLPSSSWTKYLDAISTDKIDTTTGEVVLGTTSSTQTPLVSLLKGKYEVKAVAVSKDSNFRQDSQNTISQTFTSSVPLVSYINPNNYQVTTNQWFPLQLEKALGTNMGIVSSFNLGSVSTFPYISQDLSLRLSGTSTSNSTVAVRVTDTTTGNHKDYTTTTNKDSTFTIFHTLFPTSILTISTFDTNGHFNLLPPITVTTNQ